MIKRIVHFRAQSFFLLKKEEEEEKGRTCEGFFLESLIYGDGFWKV